VRIDLHLHTTASDGSLRPADLVRAAHAAGLEVIAVTDHDTAAGVVEASQAAPPGFTVVPGIEVSCTHGASDIHILGYFINPQHAALQAFAATAASRRRERMRNMIRRLEPFGISISFDDVLAAAGEVPSTLGRPHLARALLQRGHVSSFAEAFELYLADGAPACLPTELLTPAEAIDLIHEIGGLAFWAHPSSQDFQLIVRELAEAGLDGLECYRPASSPAETLVLENAARELGLLRSGGSDWHGAWHGLLGTFAVRAQQVGELLHRGGLVADPRPRLHA
jgi:predicted metal-dependent phosphoesterase TrpH